MYLSTIQIVGYHLTEVQYYIYYSQLNINTGYNNKLN